MFPLDPALDITQYAHTRWPVSEGFAKGVIRSLAQTLDGYLWVGTDFGLFRFDGVRAVPWQPPAGQRLPANSAARLLGGRDGTLWIGTMLGLASWNAGKLTVYPELRGQSIDALLEDRAGTIWVGGWAPSGGTFCSIQGGNTRCYGKDGHFGSGVTALYEDRDGHLWAGAEGSLWQWKPGPPKQYALADPGDSVSALTGSDDGGILVAKRSGITKLNHGKAEPYPLPAGLDFKPASMLRDRHGGLWIGAVIDAGLLHIHNGKTDVFTPSDGLSGGAVSAFVEDVEGNLWVATVDGLDRFREFAIPTISVQQGLSSRGVAALLGGHDGSLWMGTSDGLNRWCQGQITIYRKRTMSGRRPAALFGGPTVWPGTQSNVTVRDITDSGLPADRVDSLFEDQLRQLWVGTYNGVAVFRSGRFSPVKDAPSGTIYAIAGGYAGQVWISHSEGLFRFEGTRLAERVPWARLGRAEPARALMQDPVQGGLWVAFLSGGAAYFENDRLRASYSVAEGLGEGVVGGFYIDGNRTVWVGTEGGLSRIKEGRVLTLTTKNGLPCNLVHWMNEDDIGFVWLYLGCGIVRIPRSELNAWVLDPKRKIDTTLFDSSDGVRSLGAEVGTAPVVAKTVDSRIWFLPFGGVSVIDPHRLAYNALPPPVHIESIKADGKSYDLKPGTRLPANVRDVWIDYTALSLAAAEKVHFKYRLEGQDPDWIDVINDRQAQYTNLPPRKYRFRVIASNNSGVWNETGDTLEFSVAPAWNQTTWFYASCVAAFLAVLWGIFRLRLYQIRREFNAQLDGRVDERLRVARDLHDTMLQSFQAALIQMQAGYNLLSRRPEKAAEAFQKAITTSADAIVEGREAIQSMRSSAITKNDLARALRVAGDQMAAEGSATFEVRVQGSSRDVHPILRDEVYRIALEALRNAFKHAEAKAIEAEIEYGDSLRVRVRDDGKGIDPAILKEGRRSGHYGLPGMRERADRIGGRLDFWSGAGAGTEIQLSIPGNIAFGRSGAGSLFRRFRRKRKSETAEQS